MITIDLSDPKGWERLALLHDVLDAHASGMIHFDDQRALFAPDLPTRLVHQMHQHPDVLRYIRNVRLATKPPP